MKTSDFRDASNLTVVPSEAITGFLDLPGLGRMRLDFLITRESGAYYIRCLDLGVMSCGNTVEECKENIREAILIYLEDLPEGQGIYKPAPARYWQMFYELRARDEVSKLQSLSQGDRGILQNLLRRPDQVVLQYAQTQSASPDLEGVRLDRGKHGPRQASLQGAGAGQGHKPAAYVSTEGA